MDYLSLCLICKDENETLPEWLDYHILMGVERFYIYDNESKVSLRESLKDYIERGWVVLTDIPGQGMQLHAYDHCLRVFGANTFWLGFIDTDEFLVPKTTLDLKQLLKDYEAFGGLAVSSLFFGSNAHKTRPLEGQIAAYTRRVDAGFKDYTLVKSIVQPGRVVIPYSPHDFVYQENAWCVNEAFLRVDNQDFPSHTQKIQLNHYFCRSEEEIEQKLRRGNSGRVAWQRRRFEQVNLLANYEDTSILQNLQSLFQAEPVSQTAGLFENLSSLARGRQPAPIEFMPAAEVVFSPEMTSFLDAVLEFREIQARADRGEYQRWILKQLQLFPQKINLLIDLAFCELDLGDPPAAWQALSRAWQMAPNSYASLLGMTVYFMRVKDFGMAEKTCHLLLEQAPHDLMTLGLMTEAWIGLGRWDEALQIGLPVVELSAQVGELPDGMGVNLVKKMADYLLEKKDFAGAARLWQAGVQCQPGDVDALLELSRALILSGNTPGARRRILQAQTLAPQNEEVLAQLKQVDAIAGPRSTVLHPKKRSH